MSKASRIPALVAFDRHRHALGWPVGDEHAARLARTVEALHQCEHVDRVIVVHPGDQPAPEVEGVIAHASSCALFDAPHIAQVAARKFSPRAWRGGIGGATCYDEILHPAAMVEALATGRANAALVVGADWCDIDTNLCDAVIARHREQPAEHRMVFTQAPPGKCGIVITADLLAEMRDNRASIGMMLDYNPRYPQGDPIARDMCVQIPADLRNQRRRFTHDAPRWRVTAKLPQLVTIELTPTRPCTGPITPQHHVKLDRPLMSLEMAQRVFEQLATEPDVSVMLGGIGDAMAHPDWPTIVEAAHDAGVWGIALRTDLQCDEAALETFIGLPVDALIASLNADTPASYAALMGLDAIDHARSNIQWLLDHRGTALREGLPWIVPAMTKTRANVSELESFVDRWAYFCGQALVEGPSTGCGLMEDQAVIDMAPPRRFECRQLESRMTILSDGTAARCDQDWLGRGAVGNVNHTPIAELWSRIQQLQVQQKAGEYEGICSQCREWHRP